MKRWQGGVFVGMMVFGLFVGSLRAHAELWTMPDPADGANYVVNSLGLFSPKATKEEGAESIYVSVLLKNSSPDSQSGYLGIDFQPIKGADQGPLYNVRASELYTVPPKSESRVQFSVASPEFLSGSHALYVSGSDEKGNYLGSASIGEMTFSGREKAFLTQCAFHKKAFTDELEFSVKDLRGVSVTCEGRGMSGVENSVSLVAELIDFRFAPPIEIGKAPFALSETASPVVIPVINSLPAGSYQLQVRAVDSQGRTLGLPVKTPIVLSGVGGKIMNMAEPAIVEREGKKVVPIALMIDATDKSTYGLTATLTSQGKECAAPVKTSFSGSLSEFKGELTVTSVCEYPVVTATLLGPDGEKLDQLARAFGNRAPQAGAVPTDISKMSEDSSLMSWGFVVALIIPFVAVFGYLLRRRFQVSKTYSLLLFVFVSSLVFSMVPHQVHALTATYFRNYSCPGGGSDCPNRPTIYERFSVPDDTYAPGEDIIVSENIEMDGFPPGPYCTYASFAVNGQNSTGDLDDNCWTSDQMRDGINGLIYSDTKMKAPTTPGDFTLVITPGVNYAGWGLTMNLRVVGGGATCEAPGWGPANAAYDGWAGSAPGWCRDYSGGRCTADEGGNSPSTTGGVVSCCDMEESVDNIGYVRDCQSGGGGVDVTMTGKAKQVGFWKHFTNTAEASGPTVNIAAGGTALLTWTSTGAASCTLTVPPAAGRNVALNATDYPITGLSAGTHILTIDCEDASGTRTDSDSVTVNVNSAPNAPTITGPATGVTNTPYTYIFNATDPELDTIRYGLDRDNNGTVESWYPASGYVSSGADQTTSLSWSTPGTYTFGALTQDSKGASSSFATKTITITNPVAAALNICPTSATINEGGYTQLAAWYTPTGTTFNGCAAPNGTNQSGSASWSSSNSGVASVSTGRVTGVTPGSASIGATYSGVSDTTPTSVTVLCTPKDSCSSQSSQDKADLVCTTDTFTIPDGCGNNIVCNGARSCDYNWKEVAP